MTALSVAWPAWPAALKILLTWAPACAATLTRHRVADLRATVEDPESDVDGIDPRD